MATFTFLIFHNPSFLFFFTFSFTFLSLFFFFFFKAFFFFLFPFQLSYVFLNFGELCPFCPIPVFKNRHQKSKIRKKHKTHTEKHLDNTNIPHTPPDHPLTACHSHYFFSYYSLATGPALTTAMSTGTSESATIAESLSLATNASVTDMPLTDMTELTGESAKMEALDSAGGGVTGTEDGEAAEQRGGAGDIAALPQEGEPQEVLPSEEDENPTLARFMAACQSGDLQTVQELVSSGQIRSDDTFSSGVSGLHWAALNNRLSVVKYLMENPVSPADPNYPGGTLLATPLHWACQKGLVYVVDYMIKHHGDPSLTDSQSFNALHLAVHSSNITLVVYLLVNCTGGANSNSMLYIDQQDGIGCTALHWAAYQGDTLSVRALLKYGADVAKVDHKLMTLLHWLFMRGCKSVMEALVDAGVDVFAQNDKGKDLFAVASDMACEETWKQVLREADRDEAHGWGPRRHFLSEKAAKMLTFATPYVVLPAMLNLCTFGGGFAVGKFLLAAGVMAAAYFVLLRWIVPVYMRRSRPMFKTPIMAGVFTATVFWCVLTWLFVIFPAVWKHEFLVSVLLAVFIGIFSSAFVKAMFLNPGFVPEPADTLVVSQQIQQLLEIGKFDTLHFCVHTFVRKPLRSKYLRFSNRLVARFDHYCPWLYNDVGVRNHKVFVVFSYTLAVAIALFCVLAMKYFLVADSLDESDWDDRCMLLPEGLCAGFHTSPFVFNLTLWSIFQLAWVSFLCVVQTFQILKGLTSWELTTLNDPSPGPMYNHLTVPRDFGAPEPANVPINLHHSHGLGTCVKLVGLDQVVKTVQVAVASFFATHTENLVVDTFDIPTDYGWKQNWLDFWFLGDIEWRNLFFLPIEGENNLNGQVVDYYKLYEYPLKVSSTEMV